MHNFGTIYGYMAYKVLLNNNINIISNLIFMDVGDGLNSQTSPCQLLLFLFYNLYSLLIFFLPNFIGKLCIFLLYYIAGAPLCRNCKFSEIKNYMNYSYFHLWRRKLHIAGNDINCDDLTMWNIPDNVNIFFGFGKLFPIKFHTQRWKKYLTENKRCFYKGYNAGHWIMWDQPDHFNHDLDTWLSKKKSC